MSRWKVPRDHTYWRTQTKTRAQKTARRSELRGVFSPYFYRHIIILKLVEKHRGIQRQQSAVRVQCIVHALGWQTLLWILSLPDHTRSLAFHTRRKPVLCAEITCWLFGTNMTLGAPPASPKETCCMSPVATSHNIRLWSRDPEMICMPSALKSAPNPQLVCPVNCRTKSPCGGQKVSPR